MATKSLETGKEKIQQIADLLRRETVEPAEAEVRRLREEAEADARAIVAKAEAHAVELEKAAKERIAKERRVFESSMEQGVRQSVETLRQQIEGQLFSAQLGQVVAEASGEPKLVAELINAIVGAIEKEGIGTDLQALVPKVVDRKALEQLLLEGVRGRLEEGLFLGGAKVRLVDKNITVDISDEALRELLGRYIRKDFRAILFEG